jgi:DNA invertase Pin-like site-specific DNA recombinase
MSGPGSTHKITPGHLARKAVVYLRQSSLKQVRENLESQRLQYSMAEEAGRLGFREVQILDSDLGSSASVGSAERDGFDRLVGSVARGEVGMVLSRELSRLLRTDKDFCRLVEVCQMFDTLIADEGQIYDPSSLDDQLVLGIKGTLSVVELKTLKMRLVDGQRAKARRGELVRFLPTGYVRDRTGHVVKDPDQRVQEAIGLILAKFRQIWSVRQTFKWFHDHEVELPVHRFEGGQRRIVWQLPTQSFIGAVLHSPFYAGAYYYGRRATEVVFEDGKLRKRNGRVRPPQECEVFIRDHHEGYITWETYEEHDRMIRRNAFSRDRDEPTSVAREGHGLLTGILRCARCGRRMHVRYWGRKGTAARYACKGDYDAGGRYCLAFGGGTVDRRFSDELLKVISPLGLEASVKAIATLRLGEDDRRRSLGRQVQQLKYEAQRSFEQYDEADPRNRLAAAELERRWNDKLKELERAQAALAEVEREAPPLSLEDEQQIRALGQRFAEVWHSESCPMELKKKIVRTVIQEAIVDLDEETQRLRFVIHWNGGAHSAFEMDKLRTGSGHRTSLQSLEIIRRMAHRYGDDQIALVLNRLGHETGKGKRWNEHRVATARRNHAIAGRKRATPDPQILSLGAAAKHCRVSQKTIERLVASGLLKMHQVVAYAPWEIERCDLDTQPVRGILERLRRTGKLVLEGVHSKDEPTLFPENKGLDNAR